MDYYIFRLKDKQIFKIDRCVEDNDNFLLYGWRNIRKEKLGSELYTSILRTIASLACFDFYSDIKLFENDEQAKNYFLEENIYKYERRFL